jgi:hypothetical protein
MTHLLFPTLMRAFPRFGGFQVRIRLPPTEAYPEGEQLHADAFPTQSITAYAALILYELLTGKPHPDKAAILPRLKLVTRPPAGEAEFLEREKRQEIEEQVRGWMQRNGRVAVGATRAAQAAYQQRAGGGRK